MLLNYFGGQPVTGLSPYAQEVTAIQDVLLSVENIINVNFIATTDLSLADVVFASVSEADIGDPNLLGTSLPPGTYYNPTIHDWQSVVLVNREAYSMNGSVPDGLSPGGYDYITWLHEFGHDLGLAHPHDNGGTSTIFPGVTSPFNSYGNFNMNQGIFTTMTYNDGWVAGGGAPGGSGVAQYGWQSTMMALDVATLQAMYGANTTYAGGNDTYIVGDANTVGAGYRSIWDTGGTDTLEYLGNRNVTLDLRAATLATALGGGGFVSHVTTGGLVYSGYTIDNGVTIENAIGGSGNDTLVGNYAANSLDGGAGADSMAGGKGDDTYFVDNVFDTIVELANEGVDIVKAAIDWVLGTNLETLFITGSALSATGNSSANIIYGNADANVINGMAGADHLYGFDGNDTYVVDNVGDVVDETGGSGTDTVQSLVSFDLSATLGAVENLTLTGTLAINGTGNALVNVITGNSAANILDGGAGADSMTGGAGNDTYFVDDAGDVISEALGGGTDLVKASIAYSLAGSNLENLTLTGSASIDGTGNGLANILTGNSGDNRLDGGAGIDTLTGGLGNDSYVVDVSTDKVIELAGQGTDTIETSLATYSLAALSAVENLTYDNGVAADANFTGTGNALANIIMGGSGNDILNGGAGADILAGGAGDDSFVFSTALGSGNIDMINDFSVPNDIMRLSHAIFTALGTGTLTSAAFNISATAADASDRIIYDQATGAVYYDADGNGAGVAQQFATLDTGLILTNADFIIF